MRSGCSRHISWCPPSRCQRRSTGPSHVLIPDRLTFVRTHVVEAAAAEADLAAHQGLQRFHHIVVADDLVDLGRRQQRLAVLGLPDAVVGPEAGAVAPLPFEDVQDGRSPRHSVTDRGRGSVLLEEVEVLWPYARAHLGGLQLPARYLEEVIQGLRLHARDLAAVVPATHAHGVGDERAALERL